MSILKKLLFGFFAIGLAAATPAQAVLSTSQGDLMLSFYTVNGSSVGNTTYTVNLGAGLSFFNGSIANGILVNIGQDLETAFGPGWAENTELRMSLVGGYNATAPANGDGARTLYIGSKLTTYAPGTSTPQISTASSNHRTWATNISGFTDALNNVGAGTSVTSNSAIIPTSASGDVTDYSSPVTTGLWFGVGNDPSTGFTVGQIGGGKEAALDVWRAPYAASTSGLTTQYVTTLSIDSSGNISVIPEPTSALLVGIGSLVLGVTFRRRRSS